VQFSTAIDNFRSVHADGHHPLDRLDLRDRPTRVLNAHAEVTSAAFVAAAEYNGTAAIFSRKRSRISELGISFLVSATRGLQALVLN